MAPGKADSRATKVADKATSTQSSNWEDLKDVTGAGVIKISRSEANQRARKSTRAIVSDCETIISILIVYEDVVHRRWASKNNKKKSELLRKVRPDLPAAHRPDLAALRKLRTQKLTKATAIDRDALLLPCLNEEDLLRPQALLMFIQSRARHLPSTFASSDVDAAHLAISSGAVEVPALEGFVLSFGNANTGDGFGELEECIDDWYARGKEQQSEGLTVGKGLVLLEIQQKKMRFLVNFCETILHDKDLSQVWGQDGPMNQPLATGEYKTHGVTSLVETVAYDAYRPPHNSDFTHLKSVIAGKRFAAMDYAWALREHPGIFHDAVAASYKRQKKTHTRNKKRGPTPDEEVWQTAIQNVIEGAENDLIFWSQMFRDAEVLSNAQSEQGGEGDVVDHGRVDLALRELDHDLLSIWDHILGQLRTAMKFLQSERFHQHRNHKNRHAYALTLKSDSKDGKLQVELWNMLQELAQTGTWTAVATLISHIDMVGRLMDKNSPANGLLCPYTTTLINGLAVVGHGLRQTSAYIKWVQRRVLPKPSSRSDNDNAHKKKMVAFRLKADAKEAKEIAPLARRDFSYPKYDGFSKANIDGMRRAEANLDAFWAVVDPVISKQRSGAIMSSQELLLNRAVPHRTPEYVALEPSRKVQRKGAHPVPTYTSLAPVEHSSEVGNTTGRKMVEQVKVRPKPKTRGDPSNEDARVEVNPGPAPAPYEPDEQAPVMEVDKQSFKTFESMFFTKWQPTASGEVLWKNIVRALMAAGLAPETKFGSIWQFSPTASSNLHRSIQFHRPHPEQSVSWIVARRMGDDLGKAYGWNEDTFVLKSK